MKKLLLLLLLLPSLAMAQGYQIPYPAGTPRIDSRTGASTQRANVTTYGAQEVVVTDGAGTAGIKPGTSATSLGKAESGTAADGDTLVGVAGAVNSALANKAADAKYAALATTEQGALFCALDSNAASSSLRSPVRAEDSATADTQAVMIAGALNNRNFAAYNSTNADALPIMAGDKGVVGIMPMYDSSIGGGSSALTLEDTAISTGQAVLLSGTILQDPLTLDAVSNDAGYAKTDLMGRTITTLAPAGESFTACSASATGVVDVAIKAAVPSNRIYVTSISCVNTAAAVSTELAIDDGATLIDVGYVASTTLGESVWTKSYPVPLRGSVNTALNVKPTTTSSATRCCAQGYISVN